MLAPFMTYYTKMISNVDGSQVRGYASTARNKKIYYGRVDALRGGESQYVVTFSIWNNEPAESAGTPLTTYQNAINCRLQIAIPDECRDLSPFLYARCTTFDAQGEFKPLGMGNRVYSDIRGLATDEYGVILGTGGDHADIETKIRLAPGCTCCKERYSFELDFLYNFDESLALI